MTTKLPTVFMFSGQGSHYYRMGEELYQQHPVFRQTLLELNEIAQALLGESLIELLYDPRRNKMDTFAQTRHTHPAIYLVEIALARTLQHEGIEPDWVLGASMGAFAAATIAGAWSAEQALTAVIRQAETVEEYCDNGYMLAILDDPDSYHDQMELYTYSSLAAVNFAQHFVVAADSVGLQKIESVLAPQIVRQRLAVSHAFHSPRVDPARNHYLKAVQTAFLQPLHLPFICCIEGKVLNTLSEPYFWQVIRKPIYFQKTIQTLEAQQGCCYLDLGPSGTLATFLKYLIGPESASTIHTIMTPFGQEHRRLRALIQDLT
jgi:acyl transferase domain-containing protein